MLSFFFVPGVQFIFQTPLWFQLSATKTFFLIPHRHNIVLNRSGLVPLSALKTLLCLSLFFPSYYITLIFSFFLCLQIIFFFNFSPLPFNPTSAPCPSTEEPALSFLLFWIDLSLFKTFLFLLFLTVLFLFYDCLNAFVFLCARRKVYFSNSSVISTISH